MTPVRTLWAAVLVFAALGTWLLFEASIGFNWSLVSLLSAAGLALFLRLGGNGPSPAVGGLLAGVAVAGGVAAVTANSLFHAGVALADLFLLSAGLLLSTGSGLPFLVRVPLVAVRQSLAEAVRRCGELLEAVTAARHRAVVRGSVVAGGVVMVFGWLLAGADPVLAALRDTLLEALERLDIVTRLLFFVALAVGSLGGFGLALRGATAVPPAPIPPAPRARATDTERLIVLAAVVGLFAICLLLQLSYLFGNPPALSGSGITFAEYARRGFGELTVVVTLATLLVLALDRRVLRGPLDRRVRLLELALVLELELLLVSAFRRVWLYETAYGFTTARLYAQTYMIALAPLLLLLARDALRGRHDGRRLVRRAAVAALLAFFVLAYGNHEAWIAEWNLARHRATGQLDVPYLVWSLSLDAVPVLVRALETLPPREREELRSRLHERYRGQQGPKACRWFEWNWRAGRAGTALESAGLVAPLPPHSPPGCVTF
jgi:Domain of unknown function (DUF4153)